MATAYVGSCRRGGGEGEEQKKWRKCRFIVKKALAYLLSTLRTVDATRYSKYTRHNTTVHFMLILRGIARYYDSPCRTCTTSASVVHTHMLEVLMWL